MTALSILQPFREVTSLQERLNQIFRDIAPEMESFERSLVDAPRQIKLNRNAEQSA